MRSANVGFYVGLEQAAATIAEYRDAGVEHLSIGFRQDPYDGEPLEAFAAEVLPAFEAGRAFQK